MSVEINWLQPNRIMLLNYAGDVSGDDMNEAMQQLHDTMESSTHILDFVTDWSQVTNYPNFIEIVPTYTEVLHHVHMGYNAFIGVNQFLAYWIEYFSNKAGLHYLKFNNTEEAVAFLQKVRATT